MIEQQHGHAGVCGTEKRYRELKVEQYEVVQESHEPVSWVAYRGWSAAQTRGAHCPSEDSVGHNSVSNDVQHWLFDSSD